jgi:hypothetical protein
MKALFFTLALAARALASPTLALEWDANSEPDLAGYRLHYGTQSGVYTVTRDVGMVTEATVSYLSEGVTFFFAVTAYDTFGFESLPSDEVSFAVPPAPSTPPIQPYPLPPGAWLPNYPPRETAATAPGSGNLNSWIGPVQAIMEMIGRWLYR